MKKITAILIVSGTLGLIHSCTYEKYPHKTKVIEESESILSKGFNIVDANCLNCHAHGNENGIAPTLDAIKMAYKTTYNDSAVFQEKMIAFLKEPVEKNTLMKDAVTQYGLMPGMGLSDEEIKQVVMYIYTSPVESPDWKGNQYLLDKQKYGHTENLTPLEQGKIFALQTKSVLGSNLKKALKEKGSKGAVEFCSTKAYPLTDSMANVLHAKIKRVSDRFRNPDNEAKGDELTYIKEARQIIINGGEVKPKMIEKNGKMIGFYPIFTESMCLQCHGNIKKDIEKDTYASILSIYPHDKAINFKEKDLRGIWVVEMEKK